MMKYLRIVLTALLASALLPERVVGQTLRRVISPEQPAWIIHIDVWNHADPQKIIDMVPEDVRPFVIFNIATSSSDDKSADGPAIYDSWMKVCAQNRVWTMIQCASGAYNRMPDTPDDVTSYEQYFKDYPNFLGFNFAEQYWGFDTAGSVSFDDRLRLFARLLPLCRTYGGYLAVSFADSYHNANKMPVAYMKRNADINSFLSSWPEHFLCFEKFTQKKNFHDIESQCLGAWLSGFAGSYGIRFDGSGWVGHDVKPDAQTGDTQYTIGQSDFVRAAGALPVAEHLMLTGQTVIDGPELTWTECSVETDATTVDGYTRRQWQWTQQWQNISLDLFRKVLDGTIRIMTRDEVMARTRVCYVSTGRGTDNASYRTPAALFDSLYRDAADYGGLQGRDANHWLNNRWWTKSTGRYPAIPTMLSANGLTDISSYVAETEAKRAYLDQLFPEEYTGDIFAARQDNVWVTYNPYQYDDVTGADGIRILSAATRRATGIIPCRYNTCGSISVDYAPYSLGIIKEYNNKVTLYLNNYQTTGTVSEDIITVSGAKQKPSCTWTDRGTTTATVTTEWKDGDYVITVKHNGPLDLEVACSGTATDRLTSFPTATIKTPAQPEAYDGALQYEAELADYRQTVIRKTGYDQGRDGYRGQGFVEMTGAGSGLRFFVTTPKADYYLLSVGYQSSADGSLTINGETVPLKATATDGSTDQAWATATVILQLPEGAQTIDIDNNSSTKVAVDYIRLDTFTAQAFTPDENGEFHVPFTSLLTSGAIVFDAATGTVSQPAGSGSTGSLYTFLNHADFSDVVSLTVDYEGDGDLLRYLVISDNGGNSVNPTAYKGAFWSSKYNLNYTDYQVADASRRVCKLEWVADETAATSRAMTISDIVIKTQGIKSGIDTIASPSLSSTEYYNLLGQPLNSHGRGIHVVRMENGSIKKLYYKK